MINSLDKRQSSSAAVAITEAIKSYKKYVPVLNRLNMTVPFGSIYGLLGSSGCGKTTLLSCILRQQRLDSGEIRIFGDTPERKISGVPGKNVGYMPQEISLYSSFTIRETINFFGGLNGMTRSKIKNKYESLANILALPDDSRKVGKLSGGQKRRVSLAVALIHNPKLLILDEPTVGLDPLMRRRIWLYLTELTRNKRTTIIVTTHFIEDCRGADCIGIMSAGRLLAEQAPSDLLLQCQADNLETIVLLLMKEASQPMSLSTNNSNPIVQSVEQNDDKEQKISELNLVDIMSKFNHRSFCLKRVLTLIKKNIVMFRRNLWFLLFVVALPAIMLSVLCISYGGTPTNLGIGVLNLEINNQSICFNNTTSKCSGDLLSCLYLNNIPQTTFRMEWMGTEDLAVRATQAGDIWGYIVFPTNFSESLVEKVIFRGNVSDVTSDSSQIKIRLDETNAQISIAIKYSLYTAYEDFLVSILTDCGIDSRFGEFPLQYHSPVYGTDELDLRPFFAPGLAVALIFFYPIMTTSVRLIGEKKAGILRRSLTSGVQSVEIILADIVTEFPVLLCQTLLSYGIITAFLGSQILSSPILFITIFLLVGYAGVSAGFLMAVLCDEEFHAAVISSASFVPSLLISGILWPLEGMSVWLVHVAPLWPCTLSAEAIRSITGRGWGLTHPNVWPGVIVPLLYIILFSFLNFIQRRHLHY